MNFANLTQLLSRSLIGAIGLSAISLLRSPEVAFGFSISPGYALFETVSPGSFVTIPGIGKVELTGNRIEPKTLGTTDTIVEHTMGCNFDVTSECTAIPLRVAQLSLKTVEPVEIEGKLFDGFLTLGSLEQEFGTLTIRQESENGGTYDSELSVNAVIEFIDLNDAGNTLSIPFVDSFVEVGSVWTNQKPPNYPESSLFPSGGFYRQGLVVIGETSLAAHKAKEAETVPEPSTMVTSVFGVSTMLGLKKKSRVAK